MKFYTREAAQRYINLHSDGFRDQLYIVRTSFWCNAEERRVMCYTVCLFV